MTAGTLSFVPSSTRTKEAHIASVPVSLSCPHHINPSIKLPNPSPALAHAWTKALTQGGTTGIHYPVIHYSVLSWAHFSARTAEAQEHQHSTRKDFQTETREHPSPHSSGAETWPLGYCPQGAGCRLGASSAAAQHQFYTYPIPSVSAICAFSATGPIWDALTILPGSSSNDVLSAVVSILQFGNIRCRQCEI